MKRSLGILALRIGFGGMMALTHGWPKLLNFSLKMVTFPDPIGLGVSTSLTLVVFAEFFCAVFVIFGLYTRIAVIPLIISMLVAAFVVHAADPMATKEKALLYLVAFTALFFTNSGSFSLDRFINKRRYQY